MVVLGTRRIHSQRRDAVYVVSAEHDNVLGARCDYANFIGTLSPVLTLCPF